MKKFIVFMMACLWLTVSHAQLSCYELDELAEGLDELAVQLEQVDSIGLNSSLDKELGVLSEVLTAVARYENDAKLTRWIADLKLAWDDLERDDFEESLDDVIERLDDLGERDCEDW